MQTVSLCMIVKNEEENIVRCLSSVRGLMDEIIVVDTGSTDNTRRAAENLGARVYDFPWCDDFAAARNFSFSKANMDYCMWLDADDIMTESDGQAFLRLKKELSPDIDVVMMKYHTAFDEAGRPCFTYYRERLLRRDMGFIWDGAVHESIQPRGNIVHSDIAVCHMKTTSGDPDRNLRIYEKQLAAGHTLSSREQFYYARELMYHSRYNEAAEKLHDFIENSSGWVENKLEACRDLSACYSALGRTEDAFAALTRALSFSAPSAELCCDIGDMFFGREDFPSAVFWYTSAMSADSRDLNGGFSMPDAHGYIPCLQLCVCHYRLGNIELSAEYNERAATFKPESEICRGNREFFSRLFSDCRGTSTGE